MKRKIFILAFTFIIIGIMFIDEVKTYASPNIIHSKSKLTSQQLHNANAAFIRGIFKFENKVTGEQFLGHDLIFKNIFENNSLDKDLRIEFSSEDKAKKFMNKNVDIYVANTKFNCVGGIPHKTVCAYGGITLSDNNSENYHYIPVNLWVDKIQTTVSFDICQTKKKEVTIQELDLQIRKYLNDKYSIYETHKGNINRGRVEYHKNSGGTDVYDIYDLKGDYSHTMLSIYKDNKTVNSHSLHIDVYLYSK